MGVVTPMSACEACPMKPACGPAEKPCRSTGSIDFKLKIGPQISELLTKPKLSDSKTNPKESSIQPGYVISSGGAEQKLTCEACGSKYSNGSSCKHDSQKAA